jgi:hypothetical protein
VGVTVIVLLLIDLKLPKVKAVEGTAVAVVAADVTVLGKAVSAI